MSSRLPLQSRGFLNAASSASSLLCVTWRLPLQASSRLCVASGVLGARGLASPGPNLGAKARLFASSLCLWVPSFSEWCLPFSRCFCCSAFLDISPLSSDWAALSFVRSWCWLTLHNNFQFHAFLLSSHFLGFCVSCSCRRVCGSPVCCSASCLTCLLWCCYRCS